jgi:hypothetical protein
MKERSPGICIRRSLFRSRGKRNELLRRKEVSGRVVSVACFSSADAADPRDLYSRYYAASPDGSCLLLAEHAGLDVGSDGK